MQESNWITLFGVTMGSFETNSHITEQVNAPSSS